MQLKESVVTKENDETLYDTASEFVCGPISVRVQYTESGNSMQELLTEYLKKCQKEVVVNG